MADNRKTRVQYHCSFCGKNQDQVKRLIAGPGAVYICDECVELCREIIDEEAAGPAKNGFRTVVVIYADGVVMVPFHSYAGTNSGIPIDALTDASFRRGRRTLRVHGHGAPRSDGSGMAECQQSRTAPLILRIGGRGV